MSDCTHHNTCIQKALKRAEDICAKAGARLTKQRRQVLEIIWGNHKAHKAYDILEKMSDLDASAKPPTVYRALNFLIEHRLIHKVHSLNAYIGCPNPKDTHAHQFLICEECGHVDDIHNQKISTQLSSTTNSKSFKAKQQIIEVLGLCERCG